MTNTLRLKHVCMPQRFYA